MESGRVKHDWYQTETSVVVEVRLKGCRSEDVKVDFAPRSLSLTAKTGDSTEFVFDVDLFRSIVAEESSFKVTPTKVEVKLKKSVGIRWDKLEGDPQREEEDRPVLPAAAAAATPNPNPKKQTKNWDKIVADFEEDKPEGEAALNEMFQKIYADGSDEVKKAMNKSFSESGGTVLSTNWGDIKKDKVDVKPPDGMEYKKWDD